MRSTFRASLIPFRFAGGNGDLSTEIIVPRGVGIGDHLVSICWSGTCHAQTILHVVASVAQSSPGATATPGTTPGATPTGIPTSNPGSTPTSNPTHPPTPTPTKASPTPPPPTPFIDVPKISKLNGFTVTFRYFGGGTWTVSVVQLGKSYSLGSVSIPSGSTYFSQHFTTPTLVLVGQPAYVTACNGSRCYPSATVQVTLT